MTNVEGRTASASPSAATPAPTVPVPAASQFLTFYGNIHPPATTALRLALCQMVNEGVSEATILFASAGGAIDDGLALFTFLRALPIRLTMHAVGLVGSIAVPVFLAAPRRLASQNAIFFMHAFTWTDAQPQRMDQSAMVERTLILDAGVAWTKDVLKATTRLTEDDIADMNMFRDPILFDAARARELGMVEAVVEPRIPADGKARVVAS